MTFEEILEAGREGKIDKFRVHDLLNERLSEISNICSSEKDSNSSLELHSKFSKESSDCDELKSIIERVTFNEFSEKNLNESFAASIFLFVEKSIFYFEKKKFENATESEIELQKEKAAEAVEICFDFCKKLRKTLK